VQACQTGQRPAFRAFRVPPPSCYWLVACLPLSLRSASPRRFASSMALVIGPTPRAPWPGGQRPRRHPDERPDSPEFGARDAYVEHRGTGLIMSAVTRRGFQRSHHDVCVNRMAFRSRSRCEEGHCFGSRCAWSAGSPSGRPTVTRGRSPYVGPRDRQPGTCGAARRCRARARQRGGSPSTSCRGYRVQAVGVLAGSISSSTGCCADRGSGAAR